MKKARRQPSPHKFGQVPRADIPRSSFDLSHGVKTTFDADLLIPIGVWDTIPGDSWNVRSTVLARLATPLRPLMDNLYIDVFYFWTPYRILWSNWEKFMGAQDYPGDSIDYTVPVVSRADAAASGEASLWDYFGLPLDDGAGAHITPDDLPTSALPYRAYWRIQNDWFRDENLQRSYPEYTGDGASVLVSNSAANAAAISSTNTGYDPAKRCKKHDYFTSALPWPQKGDAVSLPLGTSADIYTAADDLDNPTVYNSGDDGARWFGCPTTLVNISDAAGTPDDQYKLYADLSTATAATINELRLAFQTQRLLERDARSGTRYVETLKAHWGVTFPDYTAQRPVYLGGGSIPMGITPVPQTTPNPTTPTDKDKQGGLAAFGQTSGQASFTKSFVEHGVIIALANLRGDITYCQGQDRYWAKSTRYDFYYPVLSGIGEQAILMKEIWAQGDGATTDDTAWGYTGRYNEYRFQNSKLTGLMRTDIPTNLSSWNLSEDFTTQPSLGDTFIQANTTTPLDRAIAVPSEPHVIADIWHDIKAARPLPLYGTPGGMDHF